MQLSQIPTLVPVPFAENGTKNAIPEASQIGITAGAASLNDGFPPLTFTPLAAGGVPPSGADFNGILNLLSANTQWANAGGMYEYNAAFSATIGGYPKTAMLAKASGTGYWLNLDDNNTTDPDTGGAGWISFDPWAVQSGQYNSCADTGVENAYVATLSPAPSVLTPGMLVSLTNVRNSNTGASTLALNGLDTLPILQNGVALTAGALTAGTGAVLRLNGASSAWEITWTRNFVTYTQITNGSLPADFASLTVTGNASVAPATASNQAVTLGQVLSSPPQQGLLRLSNGLAQSTTYTTSLSFTAPCAGYVLAFGGMASNVTGGTTSGAVITYGTTINGVAGSYDQSDLPTSPEFATASVTSGEAVTVEMYATSNNADPGVGASTLHIAYVFVPNP